MAKRWKLKGNRSGENALADSDCRLWIPNRSKILHSDRAKSARAAIRSTSQSTDQVVQRSPIDPFRQ